MKPFEKQLALALEPIVDQVIALRKQVETIERTPGPAGETGAAGPAGADGQSPSPEAVIEALKAAPEVLEMIRGPAGPAGADGKSISPEEVASVLIEKCADVLKGADGHDGKDGRDGQDGARGADGKDGTDADPIEVAKILALQHPDVLRGSDGRDGSAGRDGHDGAGIETKRWQEKQVYREGTIVTANQGQHFKALKDTADPTDTIEAWERIGSSGTRWRGTFDKDAIYIEGDRYRKDFGTFEIINGKAELIAGRGSKGEAGPAGRAGIPGKDGRDGSTLIAAEAKGFALNLTFSTFDGGIEHVTADFTEAFNEAVAKAVAAALGELHGA